MFASIIKVVPGSNLFLAFALLVVTSATAVAQDRIQLVQGRRSVEDKMTFVIDVVHNKREAAHNTAAPDDMQIFVGFANQPASGRVYVDGKAIGRFDESMSYNSNLMDVSYGRHAITVAFAKPAMVGNLLVTVRGGMAREILDEQESVVPVSAGLEKRIIELELKVHSLESEIADLKKKRQR